MAPAGPIVDPVDWLCRRLRSFGRHTRTAAGTEGAAVDWLIVGLGNPGGRYAGTRHNIGRDAVEALAAQAGVPLDQLKHQARFGLGRLGAARVCLVLPMTYMNLSGQAVAPIARFYQVPPARVLAVYDDMDLPLGRQRLRAEGGHGGHNGMRSLIERLGTDAFPRLRLGVGRPPAGWDAADHVLARFSPDEAAAAAALIDDAVATMKDIVDRGVAAAMNQANA
ncbi:MAG: aminoacyl-tRNA hydrolase [Ardenticatenales bacterium]|nr:aminoacyl-tRNA hydrolase [Ardenticatenales bacterium]